MTKEDLKLAKVTFANLMSYNIMNAKNAGVDYDWLTEMSAELLNASVEELKKFNADTFKEKTALEALRQSNSPKTEMFGRMFE